MYLLVVLYSYFIDIVTYNPNYQSNLLSIHLYTKYCHKKKANNLVERCFNLRPEN